MSDKRDDVTDGVESASDGADADDAAAARPSGKRSGGRRRRELLEESGSESTTSGGGTATLTKARPAAKAATTGSRNPFTAVWVFLRQVVAELRKVIWPNRKQMVTYVAVVLAFVVILTAFVSGLDIGFAKLILWAFG